MGKRASLKFKGGSHYTAMQAIPAGTVFKAVEASLKSSEYKGYYIRGTSLTKATKGKHKFKAKQYLFILGSVEINNQMEIVEEG